MSKRILLLTVEYPPDTGGVGRYLYDICQTGIFPVDVIRIPLFSTMKTMWHVYRIRKQYSEVGRIWVSHIYPVGFAVFILSFVFPCAYTIFMHGMDYGLAVRSPFRRYITRRMLKRAERVVVNSSALKEEVEREVGVRAKVIRPIVDIRFQKRDRQHHVNLELLTVGRLVQRKGVARVLDILPELPSVHYTIIGSGPEELHIRQKIASLGLRDRVECVTNADFTRLMQAYADADIFVMPTTKEKIDREGFGIVYLEAAATGLPCIGSDWPEMREAIGQNETGILVKNDEELRKTILQLCHDETLRKQLGDAGANRVEREFRKTRLVQDVKNLYEDQYE